MREPCTRSLAFNAEGVKLRKVREGGVLVSTPSLRRTSHAEDDSLASLKSESKKINAESEELALAA